MDDVWLRWEGGREGRDGMRWDAMVRTLIELIPNTIDLCLVFQYLAVSAVPCFLFLLSYVLRVNK